MSDQAPKQHGDRRIRWMIAVIGVVVVYLLSTGPADWLLFHGYFTEKQARWLGAFYAPGGWCIRHSPKPVQDAYKWYDSFCVNLGPTPPVDNPFPKMPAKPAKAPPPPAAPAGDPD